MSSDTDCPRCGSPMRYGGVCPVCQIPHDAPDGRAPVELADSPAKSPLARLWQSGRAPLLLASTSFLISVALPLAHVQRTHGVGGKVAVSPLQMLSGEGPYGRDLKSALVAAIPAASVGLLSFLWTRRTGAAMRASRPLVLVVALLPLCAAAMTLLRIAKHHRFEYSFGVGLFFVALGTVAGVWAGARYGRGVRDPLPRSRARLLSDDDDEDED